MARWSGALGWTVEHRKGVDNTNADCLSRYPLPSDADAPLMDWSKGEIIPAATFLAFMVGVTTAKPAVEEERETSGGMRRSYASSKLTSTAAG